VYSDPQTKHFLGQQRNEQPKKKVPQVVMSLDLPKKHVHTLRDGMAHRTDEQGKSPPRGIRCKAIWARGQARRGHQGAMALNALRLLRQQRVFHHILPALHLGVPSSKFMASTQHAARRVGVGPACCTAVRPR